MNAIKSTVYALLRRFATIAVTALIAFTVGNLDTWVDAAAKGDAVTAAWLPAIYFVLEFVQKYLRERKAG